MQGFVAAGVGVSLIAELGLTTIRDDIVVRDLGRETPVRKIYAAVAGGYRTPATAAMLEVLQDVAANYAVAPPAAVARRLNETSTEKVGPAALWVWSAALDHLRRRGGWAYTKDHPRFHGSPAHGPWLPVRSHSRSARVRQPLLSRAPT